MAHLDATAKDFEQDKRISLLEARAAAVNSSIEDMRRRLQELERRPVYVPPTIPHRDYTLWDLLIGLFRR